MTTNKTKYAVSKNLDPQQASDEIYQQLGEPQNGFVLFYCSVVYSLDKLANAMNKRFSQVELAGCTTAGEVTSEGY